jgi:hypothetical protein
MKINIWSRPALSPIQGGLFWFGQGPVGPSVLIKVSKHLRPARNQPDLQGGAQLPSAPRPSWKSPG